MSRRRPHGREGRVRTPRGMGAARVQGLVGNRRGPSAQPLSRQACSYKPKAKASNAQRESDEIVVPAMAATNNATGGKGLCCGDANEAGTGKGMIGSTRSKHPDGEPVENVRRLQRSLAEAATKQPGRRFHALYDRIHRSDVLWEAWRCVRRKRGAAGIDGENAVDDRAARRETVSRRPWRDAARRRVPPNAGATAVHSEG